MKLGGVTKLEKRNKSRTKKKCKILKDGVMLENCDVTVMLNSRCIVCTFSLTVTFYLTKPASRTKKFLTQLSQYRFE